MLDDLAWIAAQPSSGVYVLGHYPQIAGCLIRPPEYDECGIDTFVPQEYHHLIRGAFAGHIHSHTKTNITNMFTQVGSVDPSGSDSFMVAKVNRANGYRVVVDPKYDAHTYEGKVGQLSTAAGWKGPAAPSSPLAQQQAGTAIKPRRRAPLKTDVDVGAAQQLTVLRGRVRVQALSPTLLRIEPRGPKGFEDRTTFTVVERRWGGVPLRALNETATEAWLSAGGTTLVHIVARAPPVPVPPPPPTQTDPAESMCTARNNTDFTSRTTGPMHGPAGGGDHSLISYLEDVSQEECCGACAKLAQLAQRERDFGWPVPGIGCGAWVWQPSQRNCSLLKWGIGFEPKEDRVAGGTEQPGRLCGADYPCAPEPNPATGVSASVLSTDGKSRDY